jgi:hypothetical protein
MYAVNTSWGEHRDVSAKRMIGFEAMNIVGADRLIFVNPKRQP